MFEQYADTIWVVLFAMLVLYGISNVIQVPFLIRRFYRGIAFVDKGENQFHNPPYSQAKLLQGAITAHVYSGEYNGYSVEQFAAFSKDRRKFTVNRLKRKRNQVMWTVTVLHVDTAAVQFCVRPVRVSDAAEYILNQDAVLFPEDEKFAGQMHVVADDHASVRKAFSVQFKELLTAGPDQLSVESVDNAFILRSPRLPHDSGRKLSADIDLMIELYEAIGKS